MSILSKFGLPENIAPPLPLGAKDGSPYSIGVANQQASMNKMSNLLKVTQGGGKMRHHNSMKRRRLLKGGAAMITLPPLNVPYPGGSQIQDTYANLVSTAANSSAQSKYDTAWMKPSVGGKRRSIKRSIKRSSNKRSSNKRSSIKRSIKRSSNKRSSNKRRSIRYKR
jgi:hypothetical protein